MKYLKQKDEEYQIIFGHNFCNLIFIQVMLQNDMVLC